MNTTKFTAIYVRRSVSDKDKGNNSLSIEAQKEDCIRFLGENAVYRIYCEDGKSGKDIEHRPEFKRMMEDAKEGLIDRIVVKKYDRFSRNMREYLNVTDQLDKYGVGVISLSEPFNTGTKEGRMMRNNLLNFAEFERETIAARVKDAYDTKAVETGFGYQSERRTINGKTGSVLVPSPAAETVIAMFEIYKRPETSLTDVRRYIQEHNLPVSAKEGTKTLDRGLDRAQISHLMSNPLYVRADKNVYQYYLAKGFRMIDDVDAYDGKHGLFWHNYRDPENLYLKLGYHEGLVDSETFLAVQDKKAHNPVIPCKKDAKIKSWLSGLIKCAHCGRGIHISYSYCKSTGNEWFYLNCSGFNSVKGCVRNGIEVHLEDIEDAALKAMQEHIKQFEISKSQNNNKPAEYEKIRAELLRIETETRKLIDKLADADTVLFEYINERIKELHSKKNEYEQQLMLMERRVKKVDTKPLIEPLKKWDTLDINEKNKIARTMIDKILVSKETGIDIHFSF